MRCFNDVTQISSHCLDGTPAGSLALENPAANTKYGQLHSWQSYLRLEVRDHGPDDKQTPLGHPDSTEQATKRQLPGPGALG